MSNFTFKHPSDVYSVFHMTIRIIFYNVKCQSSTEHVLIAFTVPRLKFKLHSVGFKVLYILALYLSHFLPIIIPSLTVLQPLWSVFYSSNIPRSFFFSLEPVHWKFKIVEYFSPFNSLLKYHLLLRVV